MCRAEGFFPHPSSCKKYYWCLDTPNQGMVAHTFSCPQGLFFNQITDGCDFLRNVNCGDKDTEETQEKKETEEIENEEVLSEADNEEEDVEDPKSLKDILEIVKAAGSDSLQYFCWLIFGWLLSNQDQVLQFIWN